MVDPDLVWLAVAVLVLVLPGVVVAIYQAVMRRQPQQKPQLVRLRHRRRRR